MTGTIEPFDDWPSGIKMLEFAKQTYSSRPLWVCPG
jgi:hypothetical protein